MLRQIWKNLTGVITQPPDHQHSAQNQPVQLAKQQIDISQSRTTENLPAIEPLTCWIPAGQTVTVADYVIPGGMIYVGHQLPMVRGTNEADPCLINPRLEVDLTNLDQAGEGMSYWPSYSNIPASCRAAYLNWLACGRSQPDCYIGYVFLFFYGLERRVFVDLKESSIARSEELELITTEVKRLLEIYGGNGSFSLYANDFLRVCLSLQTQEDLYNLSPPLEGKGWEVPFVVQMALGQLVAAGKPIPSNWALSWYIHSPQTRLRTPATRCLKEFQQLFRLRYEQQYGEGIVLKPNKKKLKCSYHPASATFGNSITIDISDLPDVTARSAPIERLQPLVENCTDALEPFSRWLGRNSGEQISYAAITLLPSELTEQYQEDVKVFCQWLADSLCHDDQRLIVAEDLLHYWQPGAVKLAKADAILLSQFLEKQGYGIEPDVRFGGKAGALEDSIVLFKLPVSLPETLSLAYSAATLVLHLAVAIANADREINVVEQTFLESYLNTAPDLIESEHLRLRAHLVWLVQKNPSIQGLKPRLDAIAPEQRTAIAEFLVSVAGADGSVNSKEISTLTKIYQLLGLESQQVYSHIHQSSLIKSSTPATEPVTVRLASSKQKGFVIPAPPTVTEESEAKKRVPEFKLDENLIEAKKVESAAVAAILGNIFAEDELLAASSPQEASISGLDRPHAEFVRKLATQSRWNRSELAEIAAELALLLDGALNTINEAAFDRCEALLTDGDDPIEINSEVLEELLS